MASDNQRALPPSLYADTAVPPAPTPPLDGDRTASVAIIGGGFAGLSTALHLAARGVDTIVLEAREPGWGASGNNGGQVNPGLKLTPDAIEDEFGADLGRRMLSFSYGAPTFTFDLIRRYQIPCEARQNGTLRVAYQASGASDVETLAAQCGQRDMPVALLDRAQLRETTGTDRYVRGLLDRRGGDLHPLSYARGLARAAIGAGAAMHGDTPALSLERDSQGWRIKTPRAVVRAEKILIATNGFADDLWPDLRRTIVPVFSSIAATAPLPDDVVKDIMPTRSVLYESGHITVYYRIDQNNRLLMGGRGPMRWNSPAIGDRLSHPVRRAALAATQEHDLDARLEQPPRHDRRPPPARARAARRRADLSRLQRPRRCACNRDGRATGAKADRGRERTVRHADHTAQAHSLPRALAAGREERRALGADSRSARPVARVDSALRRTTSAPYRPSGLSSGASAFLSAAGTVVSLSKRIHAGEDPPARQQEDAHDQTDQA